MKGAKTLIFFDILKTKTYAGAAESWTLGNKS